MTNRAETPSTKPLPTSWMSANTTMGGLVRQAPIVRRITNTSISRKPGPPITTIRMWLFSKDLETSSRALLSKTPVIGTQRTKRTTTMAILCVRLLSSKLTWKSQGSHRSKNPLMEHSMAPTLSVVSGPTQRRTPSKISGIRLMLKTTSPLRWWILWDKSKFGKK